MLAAVLATQWGGERSSLPQVGDPRVNATLLEIQQSTGGSAPFSDVVGRMKKHIENQNYSQEERQHYSTEYMGGVEGKEPVKERQVRNRNIQLIRMSLAFYERNRDAWRRLVAEYKAIGANLKVKELIREMSEIFGEDESYLILQGVVEREEEKKSGR